MNEYCIYLFTRVGIIKKLIMLFFDVFFYMIYSFSTKTLKRDTDNAEFSAEAFMTACVSFFTCSIFQLLGIIHDNVVSRWTLDNDFISAMLIAIFPYIFFSIRYFKCLRMEKIKKEIKKMSDGKRIAIKTIVVIFIFAAFINSYVFYRMYKFGHV